MTKLLQAKRIDCTQFLNKVIYRCKTACDKFCNFDDVAENPEENIVGELELDPDSENDDTYRESNVQNAHTDVYCLVCLVARKTVLFSLCRHLIMCDPCYVQYFARKKKEYDDTLHLYVDFEVPPPFLFECLKCRKMTTEDKVITIFP